MVMIKTILETLQFLHEKGHHHGDIRPENIQIGSGKSSLAEIKLVGFTINPMLDSQEFIAPEALKALSDIKVTNKLVFNLY